MNVSLPRAVFAPRRRPLQRMTMRLFLALSMMLAFLSGCGGDPAKESAGKPKENEEKKEPEKKKEEASFKYDVWCSFNNLITDYQIDKFKAQSEEFRLSDRLRVDAEQRAGFGQGGAWTRGVLGVKNTTDPKDKYVVSGDSSVTVQYSAGPDSPTGNAYQTTYVQSFSVPPASEKQYPFSILCPENPWSSGFDVKLDYNGGRRGSRLLRVSNESERQLIVVLSEHPGAFTYLGPQIGLTPTQREQLEGSGSQALHRKIASVEVIDFPAAWHDLTVASLIIVDGPPNEKLTDAQQDALKLYVQSGGTVLLMAGPDPARLKGFWESLAGIVVRGSAELTELETFDVPFKPQAGLKLPILDVTAHPGTSSRTNRATKLIEYAERDYGAGRVIFLPFSLSEKSLERWEERARLPGGLLATANPVLLSSSAVTPKTAVNLNPYIPSGDDESRPSSLVALRDALEVSFKNDTPVIVPPPDTVLHFLGLFLLCAVPLNFVLFTLLKRREAAWLATPFLALGFTIAAGYVGYSGATGAITVNEVTFLEAGSEQPNGVARTMLGVFAPARDTYHIEFPPQKLRDGTLYDLQAAPAHLVSAQYLALRDREKVEMVVRQDGETLAVKELRIQSRDTRELEVAHRAWLDGGIKLSLEANGKSDANTATVSVRNDSGYTLLNPMVVRGSRCFDLGPILDSSNARALASGSVAQGVLTATAWVTTNEYAFINFVNSDQSTATDTIKENGIHVVRVRTPNDHKTKRAQTMTRYIMSTLQRYPNGALVAWIDAPSLPLRVGAYGAPSTAPRLEGLTLLVVPVPVTARARATMGLKPPEVQTTMGYTPQTLTSGNWSKAGNGEALFNDVDSDKRRCVYVRLKFEGDITTYGYAGKAIKLTGVVKGIPGRDTAGGHDGTLDLAYQIEHIGKAKARFEKLTELMYLNVSQKNAHPFLPVVINLSDAKFMIGGNTIVLRFSLENNEQPRVFLEKMKAELIDR